MLYPAPTSFIPVTVALARFAQNHSWWGNYPYWYLGSTPFRYLTGPVVPAILVFLHKIMPGFTLFDLSLLLVVACQLLLAVGWVILAGRLSERRIVGWLVGLLVLVLPWHWISALALSDVSSVLAAALTPWVLIGFRVQGSGSREKLVTSLYTLVPSLLFALLLLVNPVASIPAIIGLGILGVIEKKWEQGLKRAAIVVLLGWFLTLWWYGFGYYFRIFAAPSIGGKSAVSAFVNIINLLRGFVPVILAVVVVFWGIRPKTKFQKFSFAWLGTFLALTLIRFLAAPGFWLDWTAWLGEVEVGLAMIMASNFQFPISNFQISSKFKVQNSKFGIWSLVIGIYLVAGWFVAFQNHGFWLPAKSVENRIEYKIAKWLDDNGISCQLSVVSCQTVFLSGSTAFWLNSFFDVKQVRGGADQGSVDRKWRQAAWEIREGSNGQKSAQWLSKLRVKYLVVHTDESREFYHDFKNYDKFENNALFKKVFEQDGDIIYSLKID